MKIVKYNALNDGTYNVTFDDGNSLKLYEDVIVKNNLLYKSEIDDKFLEKIKTDNDYASIYYNSVKYLSNRLRSKKEIKEYLLKKYPYSNCIEDIIENLIKNKMLNDKEYAKAFVHDKLLFTSLGPYRIRDELYQKGIDKDIILEVIDNIDYDVVYEKANKQIKKMMNSTRKKDNLRNKIYANMINRGFDASMVIDILNELDV